MPGECLYHRDPPRISGITSFALAGILLAIGAGSDVVSCEGNDISSSDIDLGEEVDPAKSREVEGKRNAIIELLKAVAAKWEHVKDESGVS